MPGKRQGVAPVVEPYKVSENFEIVPNMTVILYLSIFLLIPARPHRECAMITNKFSLSLT